MVNHLKRLRHSYQGRRDALVSALHRHFGTVDIAGVEAGMHLLWHLPSDASLAREIQMRAHLSTSI